MITHVSRLMLLGFMVIWLSRAGGHVDWCTLSFLGLALASAWGVGHLTLRATGLMAVEPSLGSDVPHLAIGTPLLMAGYFVVSLLSPLALWQDGLLVSSSVLASLVWSHTRNNRSHAKATTAPPSQGDRRTDTLYLIAALVITTIWCRDLIGPVRQAGDVAEVRAWGDIYYHLTQIARMAPANSLANLQDIQMAGSHAQPYHLAGYVLPAALVDATGQSAWVAYCGLFVPFGLLLTALAAYTLILPLFGRPAAVVAGLGLLLLPDAAQMGMGLRFLSYHWLQQVGPAGMYGVGASAMAFMFMFLACKHERVGWLLVVAALVGCVLLLKAQIFVAITYPLVIMPALFFRGLPTRKRLAGLALSSAVFLGMVQIGQMSSSVPLMRLDGSGLAAYSQMLTNMQSRGLLKEWSTHMHPWAKDQWWQMAAAFLPVLALSTFGMHLLALAWATRVSKGRISSMVICVPWLVLATYLAMAMGLALDDRHVGMPEELLHRPFVWAYFLVITLTTGMAWNHWHGDGWPHRKRAQLGWLLAGLLLLLVPIHFGNRIQTMPSWGRGYETVPSCLHQATEYIRNNSTPDSIIQEQKSDPTFTVTALSERASWAINSGGYRVPEGLRERLQEVQRVEQAPTHEQAMLVLSAAGVNLYVASNITQVTWLKDAFSRQAHPPLFQCEQVAVVKVPTR